jgi:hypothetical protein
MITTSFLDSIPIGILYFLTFLVALLAFELGYRYGIFWQKRSPPGKEAGLDIMVSASLALFSFLLAVVVSIAIGRFDTRRQLVVAEANAIGTAYLQAGYLGEPYTTETHNLLREYVDLRLKAVNNLELTPDLARSEEIHAQLWNVAEAVVKAYPGRIEIGLFVSSVNEIINVHTERAMAVLTSRLPPTVILGLYLLAVLSMGMAGFRHSYAGKRNLFGILVLVITFTVVMMLIIDLDRSTQGFLQVNQQAMIDLQRQIQNFKP